MLKLAPMALTHIRKEKCLSLYRKILVHYLKRVWKDYKSSHPRNEVIFVVDKMRKTRLRWFKHATRMRKDAQVRRSRD